MAPPCRLEGLAAPTRRPRFPGEERFIEEVSGQMTSRMRVDSPAQIALGWEKEVFRISSGCLASVSQCDLSAQEQEIASSTRIELYRRPFSSIIAAVGHEVRGELRTHPNVFYPLTPLDFVSNLETYLRHGVAVPVHIAVNPTDKCNFNCGICFSKSERLGTRDDVPVAVYRDVIGHLVRHNHTTAQCISGGGEPTLHPHLCEMLEFAADHGVYTFLTTNGCRVAGRLLDLIAGTLSIVCFSIQGTSEESYSQMMQPPSGVTLDGVLATVEAVVRERDRRHRSRDLLIGVMSMAHPLNAGHYIEFVRRLDRVGVDYVHINPILPSLAQFGISYPEDRIRLCQDELDTLGDEYRSRKLFFRAPVPLFSQHRTIYIDPHIRSNPDHCLVSVLRSLLMPRVCGKAKLVACGYQPTVTENPGFWYSGDLGEKRFEEVWTYDSVQRVNQQARSCRSCCFERQLLSLDWMMSMLRENTGVRFYLGFDPRLAREGLKTGVRDLLGEC